MKTIDFGPQLIGQDEKLLKKKLPPADAQKGVFALMDKLHCAQYLECYLTSAKLDTVFFLKLADSNSSQQLYDIVDKQFEI